MIKGYHDVRSENIEKETMRYLRDICGTVGRDMKDGENVGWSDVELCVWK